MATSIPPTCDISHTDLTEYDQQVLDAVDSAWYAVAKGELIWEVDPALVIMALSAFHYARESAEVDGRPSSMADVAMVVAEAMALLAFGKDGDAA